MIDILSMTADEVREEARRRDERRAKGLPLIPDASEPEEIERTREEDARLERAIQKDVRDLYVAFGCTVYNLSQARASKQTAGLSDLYVISERMSKAFWHEVKTPAGHMSHAQGVFMRLNLRAGIAVVLGGLTAAEEHLIHIGAGYRAPDGSLETTGSPPLRFKRKE